MATLGAIGGLVSVAGVIAAAMAVFLGGPRPLVRGARALAVLGLLVSGAGLVQELVASGFQFEPTRGGMGQGSLFAAGGMLLLTFGAARAADRRRAARDRARFMAEERERRMAAGR